LGCNPPISCCLPSGRVAHKRRHEAAGVASRRGWIAHRGIQQGRVDCSARSVRRGSPPQRRSCRHRPFPAIPREHVAKTSARAISRQTVQRPSGRSQYRNRPIYEFCLRWEPTAAPDDRAGVVIDRISLSEGRVTDTLLGSEPSSVCFPRAIVMVPSVRGTSGLRMERLDGSEVRRVPQDRPIETIDETAPTPDECRPDPSVGKHHGQVPHVFKCDCGVYR
jgi:hypothetical protein